MPELGNYECRVFARLCSDKTDSSCDLSFNDVSVSFDATDYSPEAIIRLDHMAVEGGRVSLSVDPVDGKTISEVAWCNYLRYKIHADFLRNFLMSF